eukprot:2357100-Rhodomonas_salina.1
MQQQLQRVANPSFQELCLIPELQLRREQQPVGNRACDGFAAAARLGARCSPSASHVVLHVPRERGVGTWNATSPPMPRPMVKTALSFVSVRIQSAASHTNSTILVMLNSPDSALIPVCPCPGRSIAKTEHTNPAWPQ